MLTSTNTIKPNNFSISCTLSFCFINIINIGFIICSILLQNNNKIINVNSITVFFLVLYLW